MNTNITKQTLKCHSMLENNIPPFLPSQKYILFELLLYPSSVSLFSFSFAQTYFAEIHSKTIYYLQNTTIKGNKKGITIHQQWFYGQISSQSYNVKTSQKHPLLCSFEHRMEYSCAKLACLCLYCACSANPGQKGNPL